MCRQRLSFAVLVLFALVVLLSVARTEAASENEAAEADEAAAAALAAEEAAAAAVGEAAEDEEDDDADALDEDADSARPDFELRHPLSNLPPPATDVDIGHVFTGNLASDESERSVVTLGEEIKAVVGFGNRGRMPYHVWGVMGSLNMEKDFRVYVQNFTYGVVNKTVDASSELSFSYKFTPNARLDTRDFQLALSVFYEARSSSGNAVRGHSTTFFNTTIGTEAGPETMSNGMFMAMTAVVIGAGIGAIYVFRNAETTKAGQAETGTEDSGVNEWLEDHQKMMGTGGGRARRKPGGRT